MVFYLDNCMSHKDAINENWGRELLELFSMGVGMDGHANYSEDDVKEAARAFTGWTITNAIPRYPYGRYASQFVYNPADHDEDEKTFLGETGNFNGEEIIDIIARQPATARFRFPPPLQLLRSRRAAGAGLAGDAAPGPRGDQDARGRLLRVPTTI